MPGLRPGPLPAEPALSPELAVPAIIRNAGAAPSRDPRGDLRPSSELGLLRSELGR